MEQILKREGFVIFPNINKPKNLQELKNLYQQFAPFLSEENKKLLLSLIEEMEKNANPEENENLKKIVKNMEKNAKQAEESLRKNNKGKNLF